MPHDSHYNFLSPELDGQLPVNFARGSVKQSSTLQEILIEVLKNI